MIAVGMMYHNFLPLGIAVIACEEHGIVKLMMMDPISNEAIGETNEMPTDKPGMMLALVALEYSEAGFELSHFCKAENPEHGVGEHRIGFASAETLNVNPGVFSVSEYETLVKRQARRDNAGMS